MKHMIAVIAVSAAATAFQPALAQEKAPSSAPASSQPAVKSAADIAFEPLNRDLQNLYVSLQGKTSLEPGDKPVLLTMRERAAKFSGDFPSDSRGPTAEVILNTWLSDDAAFEEAYRRLIKTSKEKDRLVSAFVYRLKGQNRFPEALDVLFGYQLDPAKNPQLVMAYSTCLFAEHRFEDALDILDRIPPSVVAGSKPLSIEMQMTRPVRTEYVGLWAKEKAIRAKEAAADDLPQAVIVTSKGPLMVELFEDQAPNTVANFISLAEKGFYNETKISSGIPAILVLAGDPNTKPGATGPVGKGNAGYMIPDEVGRDDRRNHFAGSVSMTRSTLPGSGSCQFNIMVAPEASMNGNNTVFGRITEGLEIARSLKKDDLVESITILRKRNHAYVPSVLDLLEEPPADIRNADLIRAGAVPNPLSPESAPPATQPATQPATAPAAATSGKP